jgi:membrane associated rhomboid family serine protease
VGFSFDSFEGVGRNFPLRGDHEPIVLDDAGIRHPRNQRAQTSIHTAYRDVTHLAASSRILWLGTRDSVYVIPRASFVNYDAPESLISALLERIAGQPEGQAQLARIDEVERISHEAKPLVVTWALIGICVVVFILQMLLGMRLDLAAELIPELVEDGDLWRVITANLLHAPGAMGIIHLTVNMLALLPLGTMVERPLGAARTICLVLFSGIGSMLAATWFGSGPVVGASGIVFGLAGAVLWLDWKRADELPARWRFPRRNLLGLVVINGVLGAIVPIVAFAAHAGGLVAGAVAAAILTGPFSTPAPLRTRVVSGFALLITFLAVATAGVELAEPGDPAARYALRVSGLPEISPLVLNDTAWIIATATDPEPTETVLLAALALAERAVSETGRTEPTILDTLAEVQFQLGNADAAISIINEAIELDPDESYFLEQRRRFTGEREPDDRPDYIPPMLRDRAEPPSGEPNDAEQELTI